MTIIVQCECGRTLRAPDQMAGRSANCVCGNSVPLLKTSAPRQFEALEADLADPEENANEAPILLQPREKPRKKKKKEAQQPAEKKSVFRPSQGRNVEHGEENAPPPVPLEHSKKRKKRRQDKATTEERKRQRSETFLAGMGRSLRFPFRPESMFTIGVMALAYGVFTALSRFLPYGAFGLLALANLLLGTLMILGYFAFFLLQIFRLASIDEDDMPLALDFDMDLIRQDLWLWLGTLWWCGIPFVAYWWSMGRLATWNIIEEPAMLSPASLAMLALCLSLLPMAMMSTALHLSVLDANPWLVVRSILRVPLEYLVTSVVFGVLCGIMVAIGAWLPAFPTTIPILSHIATWVLLFYALTASAYGFGNFYYRNRHKIGWFGELPRQI